MFRRAPQTDDPRPVARTPRTTMVLTFALGVLSWALVMSLANATEPDPAPANEAASSEFEYVSLATPKQVFTGSIGKNNNSSWVMSGGTTTIPTNATSVQVQVTVSSTGSGTISLFPTGNFSSGDVAANSFSYTPGRTAGTLTSRIGVGNKVTVANNGTASASITVKITGYSQQVALREMARFDVVPVLGSGTFVPGKCVRTTFPFSGAEVGDLLVTSWVDIMPPPGLILSPVGIMSKDHVTFDLCNPTEQTVSLPGGTFVRLVTFR